MTIHVLLRKDKLKCNHGGPVKIGTDESREVHDEQSRIVTDIDLLDRSTVSGCPNTPPCVHIVSIAVGYAKQLFTKSGEIPLLRNVQAPTNAGGLVELDAAAQMEQRRQEFGKLLRKLEGGYHPDVYYNGKISDPETNKGITINAWKKYAPDPTNYQKFRNMSDADWDAVYKNGYWDQVVSNTDAQGVTHTLNDPDVTAAMVDWHFNGGLKIKSTMSSLQTYLGTQVDGAYGPGTIDAINNADSSQVLDKLLQMREDYFRALGARPKYAKNLAGWLNRLDDLRKFLVGVVRGVPR